MSSKEKKGEITYFELATGVDVCMYLLSFDLKFQN